MNRSKWIVAVIALCGCADETVGPAANSAVHQSALSLVNSPPVVTIGGPYLGTEGGHVDLAWSASDADAGDVLAYAWSFGDGTTGAGAALPGSYVYADDGVYVLALTATDGAGATAKAGTTVTVKNVAPEVSKPADAKLILGESYNGKGAFTDPGVNDRFISHIEWGDGTIESQALGTSRTFGMEHRYARVGTYNVTVEIKDDDGGEGTAKAVVTVQTTLQALQDFRASITYSVPTEFSTLLGLAERRLREEKLAAARAALEAAAHVADSKEHRVAAADRYKEMMARLKEILEIIRRITDSIFRG